MKALTVSQPWAHLICSGVKPVENRTWPTDFRGRLAIHAGQKTDEHYVTQFASLLAEVGIPRDLPRGGLVGVVEVVDCVTLYDSPWFCGPYGFVLRSARAVPLIPCRGRLGLWDLPPELEQRLQIHLGESV